jgi:hypothetical protein
VKVIHDFRVVMGGLKGGLGSTTWKNLTPPDPEDF